MKSIRLFLVSVLFSVVAVVMFVAMLIGYQRSLHQAEMLVEEELGEKYRLINQLLFHFDQTPVNNDIALTDNLAQKHSLYQVVTQDGRVVLQSGNFGTQPLTELKEGLRRFNHNQYRWHGYIKQASDLPFWIIVAERDDARFTLADAVIVDILKPMLAGLAFIIILVWIVVRSGFRPVEELAALIHEKSASDLSLIAMDAIPAELVPISNSVNDLFRRLTTSFEREKRFTADAAHEMRNPITALKIHVDNLLEELPEKKTSLLIIKQAIDRLNNLVEQMLVLHRMSPDQYMANFSDIDLVLVTREVIAEMYDSIARKSQQIELEGESCSLHADLFGIEILLKNLIDNASKYTPEQGRIRIRIAQVSETDRKGCRLIVEDSGSGIPPQEYAQVFNRFYRVGGDRHASGTPGSGLGLSIVRHIVDLHKGSINLQSSALGGLAIDIFFPDSRA